MKHENKEWFGWSARTADFELKSPIVSSYCAHKKNGNQRYGAGGEGRRTLLRVKKFPYTLSSDSNVSEAI